ncbi:MAG: cytochrome C [Campylobacterota bacterium]|nr:cytochrome C [Campylobacterota bacterium]
MNKIVKIALGATLLLALGATTVNADTAKGQKLYTKKLKKKCGITGAEMSSKHSQDEWAEINDAGKLEAEIKTICPKVKKVKAKYLPHFYDFFKEFANDSGNVPSC